MTAVSVAIECSVDSQPPKHPSVSSHHHLGKVPSRLGCLAESVVKKKESSSFLFVCLKETTTDEENLQ